MHDMALPNDYVQAVVKFVRAGSSQAQNVFHWRYDGGGTSDENVADAVVRSLQRTYDYLDSRLSANLDHLETVISIIDFVGTAWTTLRQISPENEVFSWIPAAGGDMLAPGVAGSLWMPTIQANHTGRKYIPGIVEADQNADGEAVAALVTALSDAGGEYTIAEEVGGVGSGDFIMPKILLRNYALHNVPLASYAGPRFSYQRRRKADRGI
jgi:hypothetical protein